MKKFVKVVLCLVLMLVVMAGCGKTTDTKVANEPVNDVETTSETKDTPAPADQEKTVITVWTNTRHDQVYMLEKVAHYNANNKDGIEIDYQMFTDNYIQTLDMAFATKEGPDIFQDGLSAMVKYVPAGYVEPLEGYLTDVEKTHFGEGAFVDTVNMFDGHIYSLPSTGTTTRLIYNKGIFERAGITAPPTTLAEMVEDARIITEKLSGEGIYGYGQNMKSPGSALSRSIDFILQRSGGNRTGYDFGEGKFSFAGYKPILEAYQEMFSNGIAFPGCESLDIDPLRTQFAAGKIGMYISFSHAEPGVYANQFPTTEDWSVAQLPTIDGTVKGTQPLLGGTWYCMNSEGSNKEKTWKVMQYLYGDEIQKGYHEAGLGLSIVPAIIEISETPDTITKWPELAFTENDKIWPNTPLNVTPEGLDKYSVFVGIIYSLDEFKDIDKALADLDERYNAAYQKAITDGTSKLVQYENFDVKNPADSVK